MQPLPWPVVAAFLRLGMKYDFSQLRVDALKRIRLSFPTELALLQNAKNRRAIQYDAVLPSDVIKLARERNLLAPLPSAYLVLSLDHNEKLLLQNTEVLASDDQLVLYRGWREITRRQSRTTFAWLDASSDIYTTCSLPARCPGSRKSITSSLFSLSPRLSAFILWNTVWEERLCAACGAIAKAAHNQGRQDMWDQLPGIYGLPGWDELEKIYNTC